MILRLHQLDQRRIWQGLQRLLRVTQAQCWADVITKELIDVKYAAITPPRNHFLYKANYWPLDDLAADVSDARLDAMIIPELDAETDGFLVRLSFLVYYLFETLINDLAKYSPVIMEQVEASRFQVRKMLPEMALYRDFIAHVGTAS